ncbi:spore coat protein SP96-like [Oreochromis niloticus]|uniref:spore coat protein SP96-like n=1 Tax=Oreochromis niloticus TaxID=8128 RepID=UPI000DF25388|nr:spore coat protein SP96-like [Oreochromis niloticus]
MARRGPRLIDSHLDFAAEEGLPEVIRILDDSLQSPTSSGEAQDTDTQRISEGEYGEYFPTLSPSSSSDEAQDTDTQRISEGEYAPSSPLSSASSDASSAAPSSPALSSASSDASSAAPSSPALSSASSDMLPLLLLPQQREAEKTSTPKR